MCQETKTPETREEKILDRIKTLYKCYLIDDTVSHLSFSIFLFCEECLTKEERDQCEREVFGCTMEEKLKRILEDLEK